MLGYQNLKEVIFFIGSLGNGFGKAMEDDKWDIGDAIHFLPAMRDLFPAISDIGSVDDELLDLDDTEKESLKAEVIQHFDIPQDNVEQFIERALGVGLDLLMIVKEFFRKEEEPPQ